MAFEIPKQPYSGEIGKTTVGTGSGAVTLGGENSYPFHLFEGKMPNPPKIAMEVWDYDPSEEWPAAAIEPFKDVISSPDAWAKKCVDEYGADMIVLQLKSTDPNGMDRGAEEAAEVTKKVADAVDVPLLLWGTANNQKDEEVLKAISEKCEGMNLALGPVEEPNHKGVGATDARGEHLWMVSKEAPSFQVERRGDIWNPLPGDYQISTLTSPNTMQPDNSRCIDRPEIGLPCINSGAAGGDVKFLASRSRHPGVVQVLLCDGSVHAVTESIKLGIWRALSTRQGGEVVQLP